MTRPKEVAHDETPSAITDHKFAPRGEWWSLCRHCGLAESAHVAAKNKDKKKKGKHVQSGREVH